MAMSQKLKQYAEVGFKHYIFALVASLITLIPMAFLWIWALTTFSGSWLFFAVFIVWLLNAVLCMVIVGYLWVHFGGRRRFK